MRLSEKRCEAIARTIAQKLIHAGLVRGVTSRNLEACLKRALIEDLQIEDQLNEEVRDLLEKHRDQMEEMGADYHESFRKFKQKLARDRKLVL